MLYLKEAEAWGIRIAAHLARVRLIGDYSGRGMRGKTCLGIIYQHPIDLINFGASFGTAHGRMPSELLGEKSFVDEFGTGHIVYFPSVKWPPKVSVNEEDYEND